MPNLQVQQGATEAGEALEALRALRQQFGEGEPALVLLFCSPAYDLDRLGPAIQAEFSCPVAACTTAGQIGPHGFQPKGMTGVAFISDALHVQPYLITPLEELHARTLATAKEILSKPGSAPRFGLVLVDGLSMAEERLMASLHHALEGMVLVGGSAGDDLAFQRTAVYFEGRFHTQAALLVIVETSLPFKAFKFQHFIPTDQKLVATAADPGQRLVREFNGKPAALAYAEALELDVSELDSRIFSLHPLLLEYGDDFYLRSIQRVTPDQGLAFHCAIDEAVVFTLGQAIHPQEAAEEAFRLVREALGPPLAIIGCDCVLRRIELEGKGLTSAMGELYAQNKVVGFSTYGEQWNGMHVNQTFTGLAFGE